MLGNIVSKGPMNWSMTQTILAFGRSICRSCIKDSESLRTQGIASSERTGRRSLSNERRVQDPAMAERIAEGRDPRSPKGIDRGRLTLRAEGGGPGKSLVNFLRRIEFQADR